MKVIERPINYHSCDSDKQNINISTFPVYITYLKAEDGR